MKTSEKPEAKRGRDHGYHHIVSELCESIVSGKAGVGSRLPTRRDLQRSYHTTPVTVNRALRLLAEYGFVEARGRNGTFVARHPPHLANFAITFPWGSDHAPSQFYRAIQNEAAKLQRPERRMHMFHGVQEGAGVSDESRRLLDLAQAHRLAGVIFAHAPWTLLHAPVVVSQRLPRVGIMAAVSDQSCPTVYPDLEGFIPKAFRSLAEHGRRRVGVLMLGSTNPRAAETRLMAEAGRQGLILRSPWVQGVGLESTIWAQQVIKSMFDAPKTDRPDSLVIDDDNLVQHATQGLLAAGVRVPDDVEVVVLANFPWAAPSAVPVRPLGYDITQLVALCMTRIEQQRKGEPYPVHTAIPALFEEEIGKVATG